MNSALEQRANELDRADPLAPMRDRFDLPDAVIYLDGNSLGALPKGVSDRVARAVATEWGNHLITAWNKDDWVGQPARVGDAIGRLVGGAPGTVLAGDSTTINVFKVLSSAIGLKGDRATILSDTGNFPTDLYVAQGLAARFPDVALKMVEPDAVADAIDDGIDILMLTEVDYRTGRKHDMAALTELAHAHGVLTIWDLAHSAGAFAVDLERCRADFAVGCGYKYLNGGPGAPAFFYVAQRHHQAVAPLLAGWFGHEAPFAFDLDFRPAAGADRLRVGTPPVLSMTALEAALAVFDDLDFGQLETKSHALTGFFIDAIDPFADELGLNLATPRDPHQRGSHVSWRHEHAYPVMQALIAGGVIGDMRAPDILRFGFAPLYNSFAEVAQAASTLEQILREKSWDQSRFHARNAVT